MSTSNDQKKRTDQLTKTVMPLVGYGLSLSNHFVAWLALSFFSTLTSKTEMIHVYGKGQPVCHPF